MEQDKKIVTDQFGAQYIADQNGDAVKDEDGFVTFVKVQLH